MKRTEQLKRELLDEIREQLRDGPLDISSAHVKIDLSSELLSDLAGCSSVWEVVSIELVDEDVVISASPVEDPEDQCIVLDEINEIDENSLWLLSVEEIEALSEALKQVH